MALNHATILRQVEFNMLVTGVDVLVTERMTEMADSGMVRGGSGKDFAVLD